MRHSRTEPRVKTWIAQTLGIGLSAAKMRLHRAHRQCLEKIDLDALAA